MELSNEQMYDWWNGAAKSNAMTAILSNCENWDQKQFFKSGETWLEECAAFAGAASIRLGGEVALDFGCGIGRMTQALLKHYNRAIGIDISDEMIRQARECGRALPLEFRQATRAPLPLPDDSVDLAFSTIVIQHISPPINLTMTKELFRVSRSLVLIDAPSQKLRPSDPEPGGGIYLLNIQDVGRAAAEYGLELLALRNFPATPTRHYQYLFAKL